MTLEAFARKHGISLVYIQKITKDYDSRGRITTIKKSWTCTLEPHSAEISYSKKSRPNVHTSVNLTAFPLFSSTSDTRKACRHAIITKLRDLTIYEGQRNYRVPHNLT